MTDKAYTPKLRFKSFNEDWKICKFNEIYTFYTTNSLSRDRLNYDSGKVKNIHYGDIHTKFSTIFEITNENVPYINCEINLIKIKKENYCCEGDLVIADASEDYKDIGKTIEIKSLNDQKVLAGLHTFLARPIENKMAIGFAGYLMQSWTVRKQIMTIAQGTKVLGISTGRLGGIDLPHPSNDEQQKISDFLSSIDTRISKLTEKHRLLKEYKKGAMQQIFSQKIRFKQDNGEAFPDWEEGRLDTFLERVSEIVEVKSSESYREIGIRCHGKGLFHKELVTGKELGNKRVFHVHTKALIINIVFAWERAVALTSNNEKGFIASHRFPMFIPLNQKSDLDYLLYFFLSPRGEYLLNLASPGGAGRNKTLGQAEFARLNLNMPCLVEQQKIADFLKAIDKKIDGVNQQIEQTKLFKKGLLQQMFV